MADRFNNTYETAPKADPIGEGNKAKGSPRSAFNLSKTKFMNGIFGALMPFDVIRTYPGSDHEISYDTIIQTRYPMLRKLKNNVRVYIHSYYVACRDTWEGWDMYMSKGRNGDLIKTVPKYYYASKELGKLTIAPTYTSWKESTKNQISMLSALSPISFMQGICSGYYTPGANPNGPDAMKNQFVGIYRGGDNFKKLFDEYGEQDTENSDYKLKINALPLAAYVKICRDYYFNSNLLQENKNWYPDDEEEFILPYENPKPENFNYNTKVYSDIPNFENPDNYVNCFNKYHSLVHFENGTVEIAKNAASFRMKGQFVPYTTSTFKPLLNMLHFRQWRGDYFTSGSPFEDLIRGTAPILNNESMLNTNINFDDVFTNTSPFDATFYWNKMSGDGKKISVLTGTQDGTKSLLSAAQLENYKNIWNKAKVEADLSVTVKMNDLRKLQAMTIFMERNARVNQPDIYNGVIKAQFGYYPDAENRTPTYIGGTYLDVNFSEITQTSTGSFDNAGSVKAEGPLGSTTSKGLSANTGYIGKFHAKDHGYIISIMSIIPEVIYMDGLDRALNITEQEDEYFPILEGLAPQATLKKELAINTGHNNEIFNYVDRYSYAKSRRTEIVGWNKCNTWDKAQFMIREVGSNPTFNNAFVTCSWDNVNMGDAWLSATEPPFDITVNCNIKAVLPMSYYAEPSDLGY